MFCCCCHAPIFSRVFCCRFWGTPIQNHKPTIVIACSVTSRAEVVLLLHERDGKASIVGVEDRVRGQMPQVRERHCRLQIEAKRSGCSNIHLFRRLLLWLWSSRVWDITRHDLFQKWLVFYHTATLLTAFK